MIMAISLAMTISNKCYQCINAALLFNMQFVLQRRFIVHKIFRQSMHICFSFLGCV